MKRTGGLGRLNVRISPSDVGKRVSVRRVAEIGSAHPVFADTIGVLTSWSDGVLSVTRRTGESVDIPEAALVAGKVVPPAPARRQLSAPPASPAFSTLAMHRRTIHSENTRICARVCAGSFRRRWNGRISWVQHGSAEAER